MKTETEFNWFDEDQDRQACSDIFFRHHPDGKFTFIKSFKIDEAKGTTHVELDPGLVAIKRFFYDKYSYDLGHALFMVYLKKQFGGAFSDKAVA